MDKLAGKQESNVDKLMAEVMEDFVDEKCFLDKRQYCQTKSLFMYVLEVVSYVSL